MRKAARWIGILFVAACAIVGPINALDGLGARVIWAVRGWGSGAPAPVASPEPRV